MYLKAYFSISSSAHRTISICKAEINPQSFNRITTNYLWLSWIFDIHQVGFNQLITVIMYY